MKPYQQRSRCAHNKTGEAALKTLSGKEFNPSPLLPDQRCKKVSQGQKTETNDCQRFIKEKYAEKGSDKVVCGTGEPTSLFLGTQHRGKDTHEYNPKGWKKYLEQFNPKSDS
jgi:hypothetical protein